ncbi:PadR family transcriptional regulator [Micromonospora sp. NPDC005299]|uniref:PadR family transcriptional regulator n=1 Tax=Micromonospora sp. NPDC005299 TaxID=3364231 RepID=UPI0036AC8A93
MAVPETLLALMEPRPLHGYELQQCYGALLSLRRPLRSGQIYSTLQRLQRDGLVTVVGVERSGGPDRTLFQVTEAGTSGIERWFFEPEGAQQYLQHDLYAKVILALLTQRDAARVLDVQRVSHRALMRQMTKVKSSPDSGRLEVVAADLAILHLDADLRWIDSTERRLANIRHDVEACAALIQDTSKSK